VVSGPWRPALHFAAGDGTPALVELLLSKGLKADAAGRCKLNAVYP
jgi:hypothetical protein